MQLYFRELGEGQPLIILHGLFGSCDNWLTVSKPLAEKFHVYLIDQRNHGRSPHDPIHTYQAMANDLLAFIKANNIAQPTILGHSMGGKAAMRFALDYPAQLAKLIVADISPKYYPPHHQDVIAAFLSIDLSNLNSREEADQLMSSHLPEVGTRQFLLKNLYRTENGAFAWRMNLGGLIEQIENIGEENKGLPFEKPTLFLRGEKSNYIKEEDARTISSLFPQSKIVTIPQAGHWVQAEKPLEFVAEVMRFLA